MQAERDNALAMISEIESKTKQEEEEKLKQNGEIQKLLDLREQKIADMENKLGEAESRAAKSEKAIMDTWKLNHFYEKLPGKLKRKEYLTFVDLEGIVCNPETGDIDADSVDKVVGSFVENHNHLIERGSGGRLPGDAARKQSQISYEQWLKLPLNEKQSE